jgi:tetratricopeptide (TPR) repeat protein
MEPEPGPTRIDAAKAWVAISIVTLAAYWPAMRGGFLWDDDRHVTKAALRSLSGLWRIWTELGATQQYYPVLHSAFWVEHRLWGDSVLGYHLVNVLLHATASFLLFLCLRHLGGASCPQPACSTQSTNQRAVDSSLHLDPALLAGLIFALHPVCVESVAWISEQKNTLSTVFYLLSALAYLRFDRRESGAWRWYGVALGLFVLAVLSKSVTATLPGALLVVLWWRRGTLSWKRDVGPLIPWFAIGIAAGVLTAWVERRYIGARGASFELGWVERCLLAGRALWFYLGKLVWPSGLMFVYPRWEVSAGQAWQYLFPLAAVGALALLWSLRGRSRGPLAGALFFAGSLVPALGFVNVYPFIFSYVADHFAYLAGMGIAVLGAWVLARVGRTAGVAVVCVLGLLTWRQSGLYRDVETLYRASLVSNPASWMSHDNLGVILARQGKLGEALGHYGESLRLNPRFPETYNNLGNALAQMGRTAEAGEAYGNALRLLPAFPEAEFNWGNALGDAGLLGPAAVHYERALRLRAEYPEAEYRLANALANSGQVERALGHYEAAVRLRPDYAEARANLGLALNTLGRGREALAELDAAVRLYPSYPEAHAFRGLALAGAGRLPEAAEEYRRALALRPGDGDVHYQLGLVLRSLGQAREAETEFRAAEHPATQPGVR